MGAMAGISVILLLVGIVVAVLWILMPFLIMGTNKRLDKLIAQNAEILSRSPRP